VGNNTGTITQSYATGNVDGTNSNIGGLVGWNNGLVRNTYATGIVNGNSNVGGLAGGNSSIATIGKSYATGSVSATGVNLGGLLGYNMGAVNSSYWNTDTSGQATSAGGTGLTSAQMMQQANFIGWDFTNVWSINEGVSDPLLIAF
jgi:hypothetical protein